MKRILCMFIIAILMTCSACTNRKNIASYELDTEKSSDTEVHQSPPKSIKFDDFDEINQFISMGKSMDEVKITTYLQNKSYDMNGVETRADIIRITDLLLEQNIPNLEGYKFRLVQYYPEENSLYICYESADSFIYFITALDNESAKKSYIENIAPYIDEAVYESVSGGYEVYSLNYNDNTTIYPFLIKFKNNNEYDYCILKMFCEEEQVNNIISNNLSFDKSDRTIMQKSAWFEMEETD